ncbi:SDR family NAD(P)-dependent oxidoreductase [Nocardia sp. NPDC051570]|uniref:SDR family NAD(P)-dependent oxidoreductase n=1 Tax=Nocardia sp. NPDC051570 TaxID=3364324 RepID=UPI00379A0E7A
MVPKTIVITGASDGTGVAAARHLVHAGHRVVIVGRSPGKTAARARELGVDHAVADFAYLDEVRALAAALAERYPRIDVLANNAGAILGERAVTADGFEQTFQINYLAPFLLTNLLIDALLAARASVIQTASNAARLSARLDLDDLGNTRRYSPVRAYGNAKRELILFTRELHARYHDRGLSAVAFHPGGVATNFARTSRSVVGTVFRSPIPRLLFQSPEQAARQLIWLATTEPGRGWESGGYYEKGRPRSLRIPAVGGELWDRSTRLAGLA